MLKELVRAKLQDAIATMGVTVSDIEVAVPDKTQFGDLSTNVAFRLKTVLKTSPREAGQKLIEALDQTPFAKVELVGPGFINFFLKRDVILSVLDDVLAQGQNYGRFDLGAGQKAQVEFVSANPTGLLHIGHCRQAILGDVISRLLQNAGYEVTREYYFNNAGRQMRRLGESIQARYRELLGQPAAFPEDGYQGHYIYEIAQQIRQEYGASWLSAEVARFKEFGEAVLFAEIKKTLARLNRLPLDQVFDIYYNESWLYGEENPPLVPVTNATLLRWLTELGLAYEREGAVWFKATDCGRPQDKVLLRSTDEREPTYRLPDIAYHVNKLLRGFDLIIDIFGADHLDTYQDVLAGVRAVCERGKLPPACDPAKIRVLIHQWVNLLRGGQPVKMSKRMAHLVTIDELIDELQETVELAEAVPERETDSIDALREEFAVNVVRYFILMRSPDSHVNIDLDLAKRQSKENPVYYIMYAYTRIAAIQEKYDAPRSTAHDSVNLVLLQEPEELALLKKLDEFPQTVREATEQLAPHYLTNYAYELARLLHDFYEKHRVISEDEALTRARLQLLAGVQFVLKRCFELLALRAPQRM
jgi:arginyl-tRNA synthetase